MSKDVATAGEGVTVQIMPPAARNGKREEAPPVKPPSEADKRREQLEERLASIVENVGSAGGAQLRCWNVNEHGEHDSWAGSFPVGADDPALEDLEAYLSTKLGGGRYYVRPFLRGKALGLGATITIDPNRFPKIERKAEGAAAAAAKQAPASGDSVGMRDFLLMLEQQRRDADTARREADARIQQIQANQQAESNKMLGLLIASMSDSQRAIVAIASGGKQGGDVLEQVSKVAKVAEALGWAAPGGGGTASDAPMTEKVLSMVLPRIADKVGDAFASQMKSDAAPAMRPALAANGSTPTPAAEAKQSVQETKADLLQKPAPSETKLPAGARLMKPGDVQRTKPGTRTAPTVGQAIPEAANK